MKAAVRDRYGRAHVVTVEEIDAPVPGKREIVVRVHAASVNRGDLDQIHPRPTFLRLFLGVRRPRNRRLGSDVAGVVEAVGADVSRFRVGDRVFADLFSFGQGSFADLVSAPERAFLPIPDDVSCDAAATLPHAGILAIQGLRDRRGRPVQRGSSVLIAGASGNVGPFAVQLAKWMGAEVTGVCRTEKVDFVRSLGADHVVDYRTTDVTTTDLRYDWILDVDSNLPLLAARRLLRPAGRYVNLGGGALDLVEAVTLGPLTALGGRRRAGLMLWWKPFNPTDARILTDLVRAGVITPPIDRRYPLADAAEALRRVEDGGAHGKVLIVPGCGAPDGEDRRGAEPSCRPRISTPSLSTGLRDRQGPREQGRRPVGHARTMYGRRRPGRLRPIQPPEYRWDRYRLRHGLGRTGADPGPIPTCHPAPRSLVAIATALGTVRQRRGHSPAAATADVV